jgi:hypothetical protein
VTMNEFRRHRGWCPHGRPAGTRRLDVATDYGAFPVWTWFTLAAVGDNPPRGVHGGATPGCLGISAELAADLQAWADWQDQHQQPPGKTQTTQPSRPPTTIGAAGKHTGRCWLNVSPTKHTLKSSTFGPPKAEISTARIAEKAPPQTPTARLTSAFLSGMTPITSQTRSDADRAITRRWLSSSKPKPCSGRAAYSSTRVVSARSRG